MASLCFGCDWIINEREFEYIDTAIDVGAGLGCEFTLVKSAETNSDGYRYHVFGIEVPSKETLDEFVRITAHWTGLVHWYPIGAGQYHQPVTMLPSSDSGGSAFRYLAPHTTDHFRSNTDLKNKKEGRDFDQPIATLGLSSQTYDALHHWGLQTIFEIAGTFVRGSQLILNMPGLNEQSMIELSQKMKEGGYWPDIMYFIYPYTPSPDNRTLDTLIKALPDNIADGTRFGRYPTLKEVQTFLDSLTGCEIHYLIGRHHWFAKIVCETGKIILGTIVFPRSEDASCELFLRGDAELMKQLLPRLANLCGSFFLEGGDIWPVIITPDE